MIFSDQTLQVLKNFSNINPGLIFRPGKTLATITARQGTLFAQAEIPDEIPATAGIYDLKRFLAALTLVSNPEVKFERDRFVISNGTTTINYTYAAENMLDVPPPNKRIVMRSEDVQFSITWDVLNRVLSASNVLQLGEVAVIGDGKNLMLAAINTDNPTADTFDIVIGETHKVFRFVFKLENMKMLPADYDVTISAAGIARFAGAKASYWIATVQGASKYEG